MTFYRKTQIEYWQGGSQAALRLAFEESRKRHSLSRGDRELPKFKNGFSLLAVNPFSRRIWGEAVSGAISGFFCDGGDGTAHNQDVYFVSLMDLGCARSPKDRLTEGDLAVIKQRLRYGLGGLFYIGMVEPAYYVNLQAGTRYTDNLVNARMVMRVGGLKLMRAGTAAAALAGAALAVDTWTGWGGLTGLVLPLFAFVGLTGFIVANSIAGAMVAFADRAGAVSALVGSLQYGSGIIGSALVGAFADGTPWPMGLVIALSGIGSALSAILLVPDQR
jgi:hypothetical protein